MSEGRKLSEDPYSEDDYLGIRPPQPKQRSSHHQSSGSGGSKSRHRSRTPSRRKERSGRGGDSGGNVDEWDRHQDVMLQRLREKQEQSRRAQEMFREEIRRKSSALRGQRPQSMLHMPQSTIAGQISEKHSRDSTHEYIRDRSSSPHRHRHHRKKSSLHRGMSESGYINQSLIGMGSSVSENSELHRKRSKRHRDPGSGPSPPTRGRSRSPVRSRIQSAAVQPITQQPSVIGLHSRGDHRDVHREKDHPGHGRGNVRRKEGRKHRREKNERSGHRPPSYSPESSHASSHSHTSRSSSEEPARHSIRPRGHESRDMGHRRQRRRAKTLEEMEEDIALLSEPDVGIGEEEEEMEEGEAGSDAVSLSPGREEREEGEHEEQDDDDDDDDTGAYHDRRDQDGRRRSPSPYYYPGRSKFDSATSSRSSSHSDSERHRHSSDDEGEGIARDEDDDDYSEDERRPVLRRHPSERSTSSDNAGRVGDAGGQSSSSSDDDDDEDDDDDDDDDEEEEDTREVSGGVEGGASSSGGGGGGGTPSQSGGQDEQERQLKLERELRRRSKPWYLPSVLGCRSVEEFTCLNRIEEGTYGVVYRARDKKTDEVVALKRLKMEKEREGFPITSLREINTLLKAQHPNIVTVREIVVGSNMDKIYIVMGYVEHDLKSLMEVMKEPFMIGEVKTLMMQLLSAVAHLHDNWILHRDLKTSNLLLSHKGILKVGDFGLAREYGSPLRRYTPVVVTLWYRAVELLLGQKLYSTAVDMWSVGCIFAELLLMKPLFPGKGEANQLNLIFRELGTPNEKIWPGFTELPLTKKLSLEPVYQFNSLRKRFNDNLLSELGFDLMNKLLTYCPERRINADEALKHTYFLEKPQPIPPHLFPTWPAKSEGATVHHKKKNSPTPPSGGLAYSKIVASSEKEVGGLGFRLAGGTSKTVTTSDQGFRLKF